MKRISKSLIGAALLASAAISLTGCFPLIVGGAVMGGIVATDRRTSGTVVEDEAIELKAIARIRETVGDRLHVNITSYNRQVLLTGETPNEQAKKSVEDVVAKIENVRNVVNEIAVLGGSDLNQRSADTLVTARIKTALLEAKDLYANSFKVVTERGTAYVMGRVTQREADRATQIIAGTKGVQRVVRVLELISEEELARMLPDPSPAKTSTTR